MASALLPLSRLAAPSEPAAGTRIVDARAALSQWSRREAELPWRRRAGRRQARSMITAARAELIGAHLERLGFRATDRILTPLIDTHGRSGAAHARGLAFGAMRRTALGRRVLLGATAFAAVSVTLVVGIVAIATHVISV